MQSSDSLVLQFMAQSNTISFLLQDSAGLESQEVPRVEAERHAKKLIYKGRVAARSASSTDPFRGMLSTGVMFTKESTLGVDTDFIDGIGLMAKVDERRWT